jgi:PilZ domain-containing protein
MNIRAKIFGGGEAEPELLGAKKPKGAKAETLETVAVLREEHRRSNGRYEDRHRLLDEKIGLTHEGRSLKVELVNLSGGGAMVSGFEPKLWDTIKLHLGENGTIECAVRWIRGDRVGLEFAHETRLDCSADEQASVLREVIIRSFPDLRFERPEPGPEPEPLPEEHRRERRHPLIWSGLLHHRDSKNRVRVRNLSSTGAMIETSEPVTVGGQAILELGEDGFIPATVAWMIGDQVGLRFRTRFDMAQLARSRPEVAPATWLRPHYLGQATKDDSPWSRNWGRLSLTELRDELEGFLKR